MQYSSNPVDYVGNALSPSKVLDVQVNEEEKSTLVVVPDYQLSLAIGKRGQNARLAAKLTGWKIDIKSQSEAEELGIYNPETARVPGEESASIEGEDWTDDSWEMTKEHEEE